MLLLVAEDERIARELIPAFRLVRERIRSRAELYRSRDGKTALVVSGTGSSRMAAATAFALGRLGDIATVFALCITRCSQLDGLQAALVHRVVDSATGESYLPDILIRHNLPEACVTTISMTDSGSEGDAASTTDRSMAGFFSACSLFLGPHQNLALCLPPDGEGEAHASLAAICDALSQAALAVVSDAAEEVPSPVADQIEAALRLTKTEETELRSLLRELAAAGATPPAEADEFRFLHVSTRQEGKQMFGRLKTLLNETLRRHPR